MSAPEIIEPSFNFEPIKPEVTAEEGQYLIRQMMDRFKELRRQQAPTSGAPGDELTSVNIAFEKPNEEHKADPLNGNEQL